MKRALIITVGFCLLGLPTPSYAQSSDFEVMQFGHAVEARIGVSIPFGGSYKKVNAKPQFALGLRSETPRSQRHDWAMRSELQDVRELKLSLTMEAKPSFLMNGDVLHFGEEGLASDGQLNALDSYDKTVLGVIAVSLAVIAGSIIILAD